jgi:hypothetical protein
MRNEVEIENIEEMRSQQGIEDLELRKEIGALRIGNCVNLTLLTGKAALAGETVLVRITQIKGRAFRGKLAARPVSTGLANLKVGSRVAFTTAHIHSLPREQSSES